MNQKANKKQEDPLYGLKHIAYGRSVLSEDALTPQALVDFARWQVCKARSILWNDPLWDVYTAEEILIEYFSIRFDEDEDLRAKFAATLVRASKTDLEWFEEMEAKLKNPEPIEPVEFEDKF